MLPWPRIHVTPHYTLETSVPGLRIISWCILIHKGIYVSYQLARSHSNLRLFSNWQLHSLWTQTHLVSRRSITKASDSQWLMQKPVIRMQSSVRNFSRDTDESFAQRMLLRGQANCHTNHCSLHTAICFYNPWCMAQWSLYTCALEHIAK